MTKSDKFKMSYEQALAKDYKYMAVSIAIGDSEIPEIIVNHKDNFESKMRFYLSSYDENLIHKFAKDIQIRISGVMFTNNLKEVEKLMGGINNESGR